MDCPTLKASQEELHLNSWEVMDDLVVTAKHLLDELNVSNDACSRTDHLFQAESRQALHDILDEYINNDGKEPDCRCLS